MLVPLREMAEVEDITLVTVQGWVKKLGAFQPHTTPSGPPVPRRTVVLKDLAWANKEVETFVCILGEEDVVYDVYVAAAAIDIRPTTKVTHVRAKRSSWGLSLHSTEHTSVEAHPSKNEYINLLEVINGDKEVQVMGYRTLPDGDMEVLDPSDKEYVVPQAMWDAVVGKTVPAMPFHLFKFEKAKLLS
ncbi:unnamed protein product [Boreogadus saida]